MTVAVARAPGLRSSSHVRNSRKADVVAALDILEKLPPVREVLPARREPLRWFDNYERIWETRRYTPGYAR